MSSESTYQVGVSNIYELLEDETDEVPKVKAQDPKAKVQEKSKVDTAKKSQQAQTQKAQGQSQARTQGGQRTSTEQKDRAQRGPRQERTGAERRQYPQNQNGGAVASAEEGEKKPRRERVPYSKEKTDRIRDQRERVTGGEGKRVYDKKSGTGRGKEVAKGGGGRGGWGKDTDQPQIEEAAAEEVAEAKETEEKERPARVERELTEEEQEERRKKQEEREKEEKMMTLDEYNKKKAEEKPKYALPEPRAVEVDPQWEGFTAHTRSDQIVLDGVFEVKTKDKKAPKEVKEKESKKQVVNDILSFHLPKRESDREDRPGRGGRGGGRGGRGGDRGDRPDRGDRQDRGDRPDRGDRGDRPPRERRERTERSDRPARGGDRGGRGASRGQGSNFKLDQNSFPALG